jgi:hypothetical protein
MKKPKINQPGQNAMTRARLFGHKLRRQRGQTPKKPCDTNLAKSMMPKKFATSWVELVEVLSGLTNARDSFM